MSNTENSNQALQVLKETELCGRQFAVYGTAENPLFKAADVAAMIEHTDVSTMARSVDEDERLIQTLFVAGQRRECLMLTEDGLYEVLMQSRKPIAKEFKRGVKTILKEIRTNGAYVAAQPEETPEILMARALKAADAAIKRQQAQLEAAQNTIAIQQPKADYFDNVLQSNTTYNLTEISKDLGFQSVHKFCEWARMHGIIYKQSNGVHKEWMPTSRWSGKGWFATRTSQFLHKDGTIGSTMQTVVTESGRVQLHIFQTRTTKTA